MVHQATQEISNYFTVKGIKHRIEERETVSVVEAGFSGDNIKGAIVRFFSRDEDNDVSVRVFDFGGISVPAAKKDVIIEKINEMNHKYRYVKFVFLNDDNSINVEYDLPTSTPANGVGEICREIFIRLMNILDEAYPEFMRALWS